MPMHRLLYHLPAALLCQAFAPPRAPQHYWHECSVQPVAPTAWRGRELIVQHTGWVEYP